MVKLIIFVLGDENTFSSVKLQFEVLPYAHIQRLDESAQISENIEQLLKKRKNVKIPCSVFVD